MAARKNGTAPAVEPEAIPKHFTFRPDPAFNVRVREYMIENGIAFPELCDAALRDFLAKHPRWPRKDLRMPRGRRPRIG